MKSRKRQFNLLSSLLFVLTIVLVLLMSFLYQKTTGEIIRNTVFAVMFALGFMFFYHYSYHTSKIDYDNSDHPKRFFVTYMISLILCLSFPMVDVRAWLFLTIGISFALFSNSLIAFYSVAGFVMFTVLLSPEMSVISCCVYLMSSYISIFLFQDIDNHFKVGPSITIAAIILFVLEVSGFILLENKEFSFEQFLIPVANVTINVIMLIFILKYFNIVVANKYRNKILELNDQEYKELIRLKGKSIDEYFRSIHTAYLAERMAAAIGCDVDAAKNCAYYHRIKKVYSLSMEECDIFVTDNEFPPAERKLLLDFFDESKRLVSKEACIVYISDKLIATLMSIFKADNKVKIDYKILIETLFEKNFVKETLSDSELTQKDFKIIKEILEKENLYYDFLR